MSLFCYLLLCVHSTSFAVVLKRKRKPFALLLLSYGCVVAANILWLFLAVQWVGLQCVIVVFPDHVYLLFGKCHWSTNKGFDCDVIFKKRLVNIHAVQRVRVCCYFEKVSKHPSSTKGSIVVIF